MMAANLKETLYTLADQLPDSGTWDDVMEEVRFRRAIETGARLLKLSHNGYGMQVRPWLTIHAFYAGGSPIHGDGNILISGKCYA